MLCPFLTEKNICIGTLWVDRWSSTCKRQYSLRRHVIRISCMNGLSSHMWNIHLIILQALIRQVEIPHSKVWVRYYWAYTTQTKQANFPIQASFIRNLGNMPKSSTIDSEITPSYNGSRAPSMVDVTSPCGSGETIVWPCQFDHICLRGLGDQN